jgi:hypothetical protein
VELRIEYVSDERFDTWLVAADVVVLPYRYIWSSGVLERARLYDRPVIASDVGGLRDQGYSQVVWVSSDEELAVAMHQAAGHPSVIGDSAAGGRKPFMVAAGTPRSAVMESIRRRAGGQRRPQPSPNISLSPAPEVAPLLRLVPLAPPALTSRSRSHRVAKHFVNRLLRWQTEPLRQQVNALRDATLQVAESLAAPKNDHLGDGDSGDGV